MAVVGDESSMVDRSLMKGNKSIQSEQEWAHVHVAYIY